MNASVTPFKEKIAILQGVLTCGAILAAAMWFFIQGTDKPQVRLEQSVTQRLVAGKTDIWLLCLEVKATNFGKTAVHLEEGSLRLRQMNPEVVGDSTLGIYELEKLALASGETDQAIVKTISVPGSYKTLLLQSEYSIPVTILGIPIPWKSRYIWRIQTPVDVGADAHPETSKPTN